MNRIKATIPADDVQDSNELRVSFIGGHMFIDQDDRDEDDNPTKPMLTFSGKQARTLRDLIDKMLGK